MTSVPLTTVPVRWLDLPTQGRRPGRTVHSVGFDSAADQAPP